MSKVIDIPAARNILKAAVEARGEDHVYSDEDGERAGAGGYCKYWLQRWDRAGCIVGVGLELLDFATSWELQDMDAQEASSIKSVEMPPGVEISDDARQYLGTAQMAQDRGETWGAALTCAEVRLPLQRTFDDHDDKYELNSIYDNDEN